MRKLRLYKVLLTPTFHVSRHLLFNYSNAYSADCPPGSLSLFFCGAHIPECSTIQRCSQFAEGETAMARRQQRGWLKKESRTHGDTWVLFFRKTRKSDGRRVECKIPIGLVKDLPEKSNAWEEVKRLHVPTNQVNSRRGVTFGDLAQHYAEHELVEHTESIHPKAHTTSKSYERVLTQSTTPEMGSPNCPWH